eukprot:7791574-Pyramimonas_sp.AAC.1
MSRVRPVFDRRSDGVRVCRRLGDRGGPALVPASRKGGPARGSRFGKRFSQPSCGVGSSF